MAKYSFTRYALALAVSLIPATLGAQAPRPDRVTVAAVFGGLSGANLNESGSAEWRFGLAAALNATYWVNDYMGLRAGAGWGQGSIRGAALPGRDTFNKLNYDANVVVRYPLGAGAGTLVPYAFGGAGAISVHQLGSDDTWTKLAGNVGAGLEFRSGRLGFRVEVRDHIYRFDRYGFDRTQHDVAWQSGLTLSF